MILDDLAQIKNLDPKGVISSIDALPEQVLQAWSEISKQEVPQECHLTQNVVVAGMGGSALGGRVIASLFADRLRGPLEVCTNYKLPQFVNKNTLVILSSYSGNTEETISAAHDALEKGAKIFGIATGGKLADFLKANKLPGYIFTPLHNPSGQPRMSLGYSITSILAVLAKCGYLSLEEEDFKLMSATCRVFVEKYNVRVPESGNLAKKLASALFHKGVVLVASEHLVGIAHAFKNQLNENSKTFSSLYDLPELNHHLLEGLKNPGGAAELLQFLFLKSKNYHERITKIYPITTEVVEKNNFQTLTYELESHTKLEEVFEVLVLGSYISFYISMLNGIDPAPIPWVDYFKEKLLI